MYVRTYVTLMYCLVVIIYIKASSSNIVCLNEFHIATCAVLNVCLYRILSGGDRLH